MAATGPVREGRILRLLLVLTIVVAEADEALYFDLIANQGSVRTPDVFTVPFVAAFIQLMAITLGISLLNSPIVIRARPALRAGAAAGLLALGVFGAFSIGAPLLVAGLIATGVAIRSLGGQGWPGVVFEIGAAVIVVALLVTGFELTARLIVCPSDGSTMGGEWPGIVTPGFSWTCSGGELHVT